MFPNICAYVSVITKSDMVTKFDVLHAELAKKCDDIITSK